MKVAIVGSGISGLSAAFYLKKLAGENNLDLDQTIFESSDRIGGAINTFKSDDLILEHGPDMFITNKPWGLDLVKELGIEDRLEKTNEENRKIFVYFNKKLNLLPSGFFLLAPSKIFPFLFSDFFSIKGKLRILLETVIPSTKKEDESLYNFVTRRFGKELFERAAQPLVSGIYVADPKELGLRATMPQFMEMEKNNGSIIRSLLKETIFKSKEQSGARYNLFLTLKGGMSYLADKIAECINGNNIQFNSKITKINKKNNKWEVKTQDKDGLFDAVILSCPSYVSSELLAEFDQEISTELSYFEYASSLVVNLIFKRTDLKNLPEGFGFVVPVTEKLNLIACSIYSQKFPHRFNDDVVVLRCFMGGKLNENVMVLSDEELIELLKNELKEILGIETFASKYFIKRYPKSMPQYKVGHLDRVNSVIKKVSDHSGLALCGSMYYGVGIPDSIRSGKIAAEKIIKEFSQ
ncbi:MAG: protoporphyrinogen oxidase [Candidatus Dadabacteria bacterium]|nr:protoporphyrinogen oxidase [Candidatus Dadabacteria bacterium]NIQ14901.1 protoporphyrinogen oxidase [Candidatus Dadabacteria bacterium]